MRSTEILQSEHRVIEQVLSCLEAMADQGLKEGRLDEASTREALDFFQTFADGCHHGKEENCLFPLMEAKGFPRQGGPTGMMLFEHEEGRRHIRAMHATLSAAAAGQDRALRDFARHAHAYVDLLRQHIFKEEQRLFPMADQVFSAQDQANLVERFAHIEHHDMHEGTHEKYLRLANTLAERVRRLRLLHMPGWFAFIRK
jgi:hemerythrin-like domain-containing protein